jgi:hypothetical protein
MEGLTRLVSESLARHGFDRPLDYRRLRWSRWFRCESHHSLLFVPSKPGVFAIAEEIMDLGTAGAATAISPATSSGAAESWEGPDFSRAVNGTNGLPASAAEGFRIAEGSNRTDTVRRMLAVTQFFEDDDMAFVLDRMISRSNPMNVRLTSGRYFARFVVIEDQTQRRSICNALNQWMVSAAEKATGIGSHFASSLELTPAMEYVPQTAQSPSEAQANLFEGATDNGSVAAHVATGASPVSPARSAAAPSNTTYASPNSSPTAPQLDSGAATNIHCPSPFPSGF